MLTALAAFLSGCAARPAHRVLALSGGADAQLSQRVRAGILLGVFWPNCLSTMNRVKGIDPRILDSTRMLHLSSFTMITRVLLPYVTPGIVSGLKVSVTTSLLMLNKMVTAIQENTIRWR